MKGILGIVLFFLVCVVLVTVAAADPLRSRPNLVSITFYEQTTSVGPDPQEFVFDKDGPEMTTTFYPLDNASNDFEGVADEEFYDVFYSDADGSFNPDGEFITVECIYGGVGGLNLVEVELTYSDNKTEFATYVASYFATGNGALPDTFKYAFDGNLTTYTQMGSSTDQDSRLRVTLAFELPPCWGHCCPPATQASTLYGHEMAHQSNILKLLSILSGPIGAVILLRILRRKK